MTASPDEAVDVAARTFFERSTGCSWDDETDQTKRGFRGDMRAALQAAAPHMLTEARVEAWDVGCESALMHINPTNPYRTAK